MSSLSSSSGSQITPAPAAAPLSVARTASGYCLRVVGRGTSQSSPAAQAFATQAITDTTTTLAVDLTKCEYLDSTFLGFLVSLHRTYGKPEGDAAPRFVLVSSPERRTKLLSPTGLQKIFCVLETAPPVQGEWLPLTPPAGSAKDWTRHVMECHQQLANIDGPSRERFARIAHQLEDELQEKKD